MISREFVSGFLIGFGISSVFNGLYLMYVGKKLLHISNIMNEPDVIDTSIVD